MRPVPRFILAALILSGFVFHPGFCRSQERPRSSSHEPVELMKLEWGSGPNVVGRFDGDEAASFGPSSFAVSVVGDIYVLDRVQARVARFSPAGDLISSVPLPDTTFEDLELTNDGHLLVLDRLVHKTLLIIDEFSGEHRRISVVMDEIPETGGITAILPRPDGIWLEYDNEYSVRVLDENLAPCAHDAVPGRPSATPGRSLHAALDTAGGAPITLLDREHLPILRTRVASFHPIERFVWLEDSADGRVYAAYHVVERGERGDLLSHFIETVIIDRSGQPQTTFVSPYSLTGWDQFIEVRFRPDGTPVQMVFLPDGVTFLEWRAP